MIAPAEAHIAQCYQRLADRLIPLGLKRYTHGVGDVPAGLDGIALAARYSRLADCYLITAMVGDLAQAKRALSPVGRHPFFESLLFLVPEADDVPVDIEEVRQIVMAEGDFVGLSKSLVRVTPCPKILQARLGPTRDNRLIYHLTHRRADARLLLDDRGLTLMEGSKTTPMDSLPGFIRPVR